MRRTIIYIEQSIKTALEQFVFASNVIVQVSLQLIHPAGFIELTFKQKMEVG